MDKTALQHLVGVLSLAGLPREQWTKQDQEAYDTARKFVSDAFFASAFSDKKDSNRERQREKEDAGDVPNSGSGT